MRKLCIRFRDDEIAQLAAMAEHFNLTFTATVKVALDLLANDVAAARADEET